MDLASIVLFVYNRPEHTRRTVESLLLNPLASKSDLIVYSDAARTPDKQHEVDEVRAFLAEITGFRSISLVQRAYNFGLAKSITQGVTEVLQKYECVIVLEDDIVTSPYFLSYMNEALEKYSADDRVISIHGYVYPIERELPEAFFLPGADCWGWATWRRGWALFNSDGQYLLDELERRKLQNSYDFDGSYPFFQMLKDQIQGINDSWAIRWYASAYLAGKLTLYPGRSLVYNIGNDSSGTHCGKSTVMDSELSETAINLSNVRVEPSQEGIQAFSAFFRQSKLSIFHRILNRVRYSFKSHSK